MTKEFDIKEDHTIHTLIRAAESDQKNIYSNDIDLIKGSGQPEGLSLRINGNESVGTSPDRYKQHGFHFTADNCIGCHACEAACSEKNDLPPHLSFRSVGYIEGGTYPDFTRINISMACNHCDDPVCLKACPTRAYTKHPEYGAVLQDPDICFGCGYCTWVCPYNAPQLDPIAGQVQKCNMCVDRLEAGLKPACVSACLGNALNFGVIETRPEHRSQAKTALPGFPDPAITKPNIRFQQTRPIPPEFTRTDSAQVKYHRSDGIGTYKPDVDKKGNQTVSRQWNISWLSSRENPLVIFTLVTQAVIGAFLILFAGSRVGITSLAYLEASNILLPFLAILIGLQGMVLFLSTSHLGKPWRFYRGFNNLRHSPLCREALGVSLFFGLLAAVFLLSLYDHAFPGWRPPGTESAFITGTMPRFQPEWITITRDLFLCLAAASGMGGMYFMYITYRIRARPFWDHWQTGTAFFGSMFTLGSILIGMVCIPAALINHTRGYDLIGTLAAFMVPGLLLQTVGHIYHARDMQRNGGEGAASHYLLTNSYRKTWIARNVMLGAGLAGMAALMLLPPDGTMVSATLYAPLALIILISSVLDRALFYVTVIPTTLPGAFFWKNRGFEEHARTTGLSRLPQVGIADAPH